MIPRRVTRALDWRLRAVVGRLDSLHGRAALMEDRLTALDDALQAVGRRLEGMQTQLDAISGVLGKVDVRGAATRATLEERIEPLLRAVVDEQAENRRRLGAVRAAADYERAFSEDDPLVTVTVATHDRPQALVQRSLPSILAQSHGNLEVIVVGDASPPGVGEAVGSLDDPRVRYLRLPHRLVAHPDPRRHWLVGSAMPRNEATRQAHGRWLLHFDDDDQLRPDAVAVLLAHARAQRVEVAYGAFQTHAPDGTSTRHGAFPPRPGSFGWQGALVHGGLRFFERELVAAAIELPGDQYLLERMLRAGVRFGALDQVVWDYFPSSLWEPRTDETSTPQISRTSASDRPE